VAELAPAGEGMTGRLGLFGRVWAGTGRVPVPAEAHTEPVVPLRVCTGAVFGPEQTCIEIAVLAQGRIGRSPVRAEGWVGTVAVQPETRLGAAPVRAAVDKTAVPVQAAVKKTAALAAGRIVAVPVAGHSSAVLVGHTSAAGSFAFFPGDNRTSSGPGNKRAVADCSFPRSRFVGCNSLRSLVESNNAERGRLL
jgi:hypothetical protein